MIRIVLLVTLTLAAQRIVGMPGLPMWSSEIFLPAAWLVGPALLRHDRRWVYYAVLLGLGWDLLLEPIVGPGGIAWSAAALSLSALAGVVADRSPRAWAGFGAICALVVIFARRVALLPLDLVAPLTPFSVVRSTLLTALWCGLIGVVLALDLPARWQAYRVRKLH
jgi:hypothetical protein